MSKRFVGLAAVLAAVLFALAVPAGAQYGSNTGGIDGKVVDEQGGVLPGVSVTVTGVGAPQTVYSDARGEFHVVNLAPGVYTVALALQGFTTVNRENVTVALGRNTELTIPMKLSAVAATVTVTGEAPVIDTRRSRRARRSPTRSCRTFRRRATRGSCCRRFRACRSTASTWRAAESGQQSNFVGKGSTAGTFSVDGVNLTDMSALGASAGYYDFDSFQEMQVITGGADASISGSGTHLNMVTKRGTNEVHGSARLFVVDHHFESDNLPDEAKTQVDSNGNPAPLAAGNYDQQRAGLRRRGRAVRCGRTTCGCGAPTAATRST